MACDVAAAWVSRPHTSLQWVAVWRASISASSMAPRRTVTPPSSVRGAARRGCRRLGFRSGRRRHFHVEEHVKARIADMDEGGDGRSVADVDARPGIAVEVGADRKRFCAELCGPGFPLGNEPAADTKGRRGRLARPSANRGTLCRADHAADGNANDPSAVARDKSDARGPRASSGQTIEGRRTGVVAIEVKLAAARAFRFPAARPGLLAVRRTSLDGS